MNRAWTSETICYWSHLKSGGSHETIECTCETVDWFVRLCVVNVNFEELLVVTPCDIGMHIHFDTTRFLFRFQFVYYT